MTVGVEDEGSDRTQLVPWRPVLGVGVADDLQQDVPPLGEKRVQDLLLRAEVVVDEAVRDAGLVGDVSDATGVEPLAREHTHRRVQDLPPTVRGSHHATG
jgi:hypothetical protein